MSDTDIDEMAPTTLEPSMPATPDVVVALVGIRVGGHPALDRVVFDFEGGAPGFFVRHVRQLFQDGSGNVLPVDGRAVLQVVLSPATAHDGGGAPTMKGGVPSVAGFAALRDLVPAGDFEATVSWGIGVAARSPFRATRLAGPSRVVVDVVHVPPGRGRELLRLGDEGAAVATWQWRLRLALNRAVAVDETFAAATDAATRDFQRARGLGVDGIVGPLTRAAMEQVLGI